jgi:hypothetical protein
MEREPIEIIKLDDVEIQHFDEDPDGASDRAGDGLYFQLPGEDSWSGVWHSEDECYEVAEQDLQTREERAWQSELEAAGYRRILGDVWPINPVNGAVGYARYARKTDDVYHLVCAATEPELTHVIGEGTSMMRSLTVLSINADKVDERVVPVGEADELRALSWTTEGRDGFVSFGPDDPSTTAGDQDAPVRIAFVDIDVIEAALGGVEEFGQVILDTSFKGYVEGEWQEEFGHAHQAVRDGMDAADADLEARNVVAPAI